MPANSPERHWKGRIGRVRKRGKVYIQEIRKNTVHKVNDTLYSARHNRPKFAYDIAIVITKLLDRFMR